MDDGSLQLMHLRSLHADSSGGAWQQGLARAGVRGRRGGNEALAMRLSLELTRIDDELKTSRVRDQMAWGLPKPAWWKGGLLVLGVLFFVLQADGSEARQYRFMQICMGAGLFSVMLLLAQWWKGRRAWLAKEQRTAALVEERSVRVAALLQLRDQWMEG